MAKLGMFLFGIILVVWQGFVLQTLWGWFIVPTFEIAKLSVAAAVGIIMIVTFLTKNWKVKEILDDDDLIYFSNMVIAAAHALLCLIGGGVISVFFMP